MRNRVLLAALLLAACGGGGSAQTDAPPGGGSDARLPDGAQPDSPNPQPDAAIDAMADAMVDAPGTGADAMPTGMYMGPMDGNRCSEDLWCPVEPAIPATLRAMGGTGPNDVWAVGEAGTMLHWDGTRLTRVPTNTRGEIEDIYAAAPNDVWAIASPKQLLHFNGSTWSPVTVSTLDYPIKMSGQNASSIWILEYGGVTHRFNGTTWQKFQIPVSTSVYMYSIWASGPNDAWAGGGGNSLFHFNGTSWTPVTSPSTSATNSFVSIWGNSINDVWFTNGGTAWHWDGQAFTQGMGSLSYQGYIKPMWGRASNDIWAPGDGFNLNHYNGTAWSSVPLGVQGPSFVPSGLSGFSAAANDVWVTTIYGGLIRGTGTTFDWVEQSAVSADRKAIWAAAPDDVWVVGEGNARHFDGTAWSDRTIPAHGTFNAIFGLAANNIYAAGDGGTIFQYNGTTWTKIPNIPTTTWSMYAIWASSPSDVYVMGYLGNLSYYNGTTWTSMWSGATTNHVYGLHGFGTNDLWGVTENGGVIHKTAAGWTKQTLSQYHLYAIWGAAANDIWAAGFNGFVYHYNGTSWSEVVTPAKMDYADIRAIRGRSASDIYMTGSNGAVYHYNGTTWTRELSGSSAWTRGIGFAGAKTFIVGDDGSIIQK